MTSNDEGGLLAHYLAALAYRARKATRDAPEGFGSFRAGAGTRSPSELLHHMSQVIHFAVRVLAGDEPETLPPAEAGFEAEVIRFHELLEALRDRLQVAAELDARRLLQGPLADAMCHAGQLSMLRRLAGSPIPPESFYEADISPANLSPDQPHASKPPERDRGP